MPQRPAACPALDLGSPVLTPRRAVIYGTGAVGRAARSVLERDHTRSVLAFADPDPRKQGTMLDDLRVIALEGLPPDWFDDVVVASQAWRHIVRSIVRLGIGIERIWLYRADEHRIVPISQVSQRED